MSQELINALYLLVPLVVIFITYLFFDYKAYSVRVEKLQKYPGLVQTSLPTVKRRAMSVPVVK